MPAPLFTVDAATNQIRKDMGGGIVGQISFKRLAESLTAAGECGNGHKIVAFDIHEDRLVYYLEKK
jgi:hypothetical protein